MGCINKCRQLFHSDDRLAEGKHWVRRSKAKTWTGFWIPWLATYKYRKCCKWFRRLWTEYTTQALEVWIDPVHLYILVCVTSIYTLHNKQSITYVKGSWVLTLSGNTIFQWGCYTLAIDCSVCSAWQFYCLVSATCRNWGNRLTVLQTILLYFFIFVNSMRCLSFM